MLPVSSAPSRRTLYLPGARLQDLAAIRAFLHSAATELGVDDSTIPDLVIAVNEAAANILRHGYPGKTGPIEIEVEREPDSIVIRLRDEAAPFDPTSVAPPDLSVPLERKRAGGLGVHLTRTGVDEMTHSALHNVGNELTLVKSLRDQEGRTGG
jgi:anti-sigma regulatory factor (Ser/Thr protein kinase)